MTSDVTIVTCAALPDGAPDDRLLAGALADVGLTARLAAWTDRAIDWAASPVTIVRSTWDYHRNPGDWFAWIDRAATATRLLNAPATMRWNSEKGYLRDLAEAGVPIVPTRFVEAGEDVSLAAICAAAGWDDVVVKPAVGASAYGAGRFAGDAIPTGGEAHLDALRPTGRVLAQPYQRAVETQRERSLVFIGGAYTHAFLRTAFSGGAAAGADEPELHAASDAEIALGHAALAAAPSAVAYARVDLVPATDGPVLMELELIEPDLGLRANPDALHRLARLCAEALEPASAS